MHVEARLISRGSLFTTRRVWELRGDRLAICTEYGDVEREWRLCDVREVRLFRLPSRFVPNYAGCELRLSNGSTQRIMCGESRFPGWIDRAESYRAFVTILAPAISRASPDCVFRVGRREPRHTLFMLTLLTLVFTVSWSVTNVAGMADSESLLVAAIASAIFLIHLAESYWMGRRGKFDADAIPARILPHG